MYKFIFRKDKEELPPAAAARQDRTETMESVESFKKKHSSAGANEEGALSVRIN